MTRTRALATTTRVLCIGLACLLLPAGCRGPTPAPATGTAVPAAAPTATPELPADGPALALVNGTLIDGTGAAPVADAAVVTRAGRIAAVGPQSQVSIPAGARVVDVEGATILPGFINAHVHDAYEADNLAAWAQAGVTTVRDLGTTAATLATAREQFALRGGALAGPGYTRLIAASPMLTTRGGYGFYTVTSAEDARRAVDDLIDAGADLIKTSVEDDLQGRRWATLSMEELKAIVEAAHARQRRVSVHVSRAEHVGLALEAGADDLAHMVVDDLPDDLIDQVVAGGVYWTPTLELWKGVGWGAKPVENLRRFVAAGGQVALGTDFGGYHIPFDLGMPIHEIEYMQEAGMTPMQIIVAATRNAAHVCGREHDLGTLEVGKIADLFVVDGDPLADLHALLSLRLVIRDGSVVYGDG